MIPPTIHLDTYQHIVTFIMFSVKKKIVFKRKEREIIGCIILEWKYYLRDHLDLKLSNIAKH